jgi:hypothetical protein
MGLKLFLQKNYYYICSSFNREEIIFNREEIMKNDNLKKALQRAIYALKKDFVEYNWNKQNSCNCGIVAQAILVEGKKNIGSLFEKDFKNNFEKGEEISRTWKNLAKRTCSVTGNSVSEIISSLQEKGMSPEDIVHLEYLENPAIIKLSDINVEENKFYAKKENLILYLQSWLRILNNDLKSEDSRFFLPNTQEFLAAEILQLQSEGEIEKAQEKKIELAVTYN